MTQLLENHLPVVMSDGIATNKPIAFATPAGSSLAFSGGGASQAASGVTALISSGASTTGSTLRVTTTGDYNNSAGVLSVVADFATTGRIVNVNAAVLTTGSAVCIVATAAVLTTGFYLRLNDGAVNVLTIGANGHITTNQTTAPTIAVTTQNGITAAAVTVGSSDVNGSVTTTGTNNNGGATVLTVTFHKTYTVAPKSVMLTAANASAAGPNAAYVSSITATTFVITIPASASAGATPSWYYQVIA